MGPADRGAHPASHLSSERPWWMRRRTENHILQQQPLRKVPALSWWKWPEERSGLTLGSPSPVNVQGYYVFFMLTTCWRHFLPILQSRKLRFRRVTGLRTSSRAGIDAHVDLGRWSFLEQGEVVGPACPLSWLPESQRLPSCICPVYALFSWMFGQRGREIPGRASQAQTPSCTRPPCACRICGGALKSWGRGPGT